MNDDWIDELRGYVIEITPRHGFKEELRAAVIAEYRGANTKSSAAEPRRRWWALGAAAACIAVLVGGLAIVGRGGGGDIVPSTVPGESPAVTATTVPSTAEESSTTTAADQSVPNITADPDFIVDDPLAISLDEWISSDQSLEVADIVVIINRPAMPEGWSVTEERGALHVYPMDALGYSYSAAVATTGGSVFDITLERNLLGSDPCFLPVADFSGAVGDLTGATVGDAVCGWRDDGDGLAVVPADASSGVGPVTALEVAGTLAFVASNDFPHPDLTATIGSERPVDVDLAGTLGGVPWAMTIVPTGTHRIDVFVAGKRSSGAELSVPGLPVGQPPLPSVWSSLAGVPGYGALAFGHVEGAPVAVVAATKDGRTARLPMLRIEGGGAFAVPIPDTVQVPTLTFIDADGSVVAIADVPAIPSGFAGGELNLTPRPSVYGTVSGKLTMDGGPAPGTSVHVPGKITLSSTDHAPVSVVAADDGRFVAHVPPGTYRISATSPAYNDGNATCLPTVDEIAVTAGRTETIDIACQMR